MPKEIVKPAADVAKPYEPTVSAALSALLLDVNGSPRPEMVNISNRQLLESALVSINEIYRRATTGSDEATDFMIRLASQSTRLLAELSKTPSSLLLSISRSVECWPFFYSPKPDYFSEYESVLSKLEIGKDCQINVSPTSKWSWNTEARDWAAKILTFVQMVKTTVDGNRTDHAELQIEWTPLTKAAYDLPPLTKASASLWMKEVGRQFILEATQGHPEENPSLKKMVAHWDRNKSAKPGSKTAKTNLRTDIFRMVEQALHGMASPP